jgi:hypothetical protein
MISTASVFYISDSSFSMAELWAFLTIHIFMACLSSITRLIPYSPLEKIWNLLSKPTTGYPGAAIRARTSCMLYTFMEFIVKTPDQIGILE